MQERDKNDHKESEDDDRRHLKAGRTISYSKINNKFFYVKDII